MGDNIFNIVTSHEKLYPIAREFDYLNKDDFENRKKYFLIIDWFIDFSNDPKLPII